MTSLRKAGLLLASALTAAACGSAARNDAPATAATAGTMGTIGTGVSSTSPSTSPETETIPPVIEGELPEGPSALSNPRDEAFPAPLIPLGGIIRVLAPDSIPAVDEPFFVGAHEADEYLTDDEAVVVLTVKGDARAYPIQILVWHEIVNDTVGGVPVAITYCPLCNSAVSYERVIGEEETTFGTSGSLFNSALIMYDRTTETLWTHYDGRAVVGVLTGYRLEPIPSPLVSWADFRSAFPEGLVLDRTRTGAFRPYGDNPYEGYDRLGTGTYFPVAGDDLRLDAKERVIGLTLNGVARAYALNAIRSDMASATNDELGGSRIVIFWKAGQRSAFERAEDPEVGSVAVFRPVAEGRTLTFEVQVGVFWDRETGSSWDITGRAVAGELEGTRLERVHHLDTFWFAWSSYRPETELVGD